MIVNFAILPQLNRILKNKPQSQDLMKSWAWKNLKDPL